MIDDQRLTMVVDELRSRGIQLEAQRFIIMCLVKVLTENGCLTFKGTSQPLALMAEAAFGAHGKVPDPAVLSEVYEIIASHSGDVVQFPTTSE